MQERTVTIDRETHRLSPNFTVFATQNPIESEGTYPLPEAQKDRFMLKISMTWPESGGRASPGPAQPHGAARRKPSCSAARWRTVPERGGPAGAARRARHLVVSEQLIEYAGAGGAAHAQRR